MPGENETEKKAIQKSNVSNISSIKKLKESLDKSEEKIESQKSLNLPKFPIIEELKGNTMDIKPPINKPIAEINNLQSIQMPNILSNYQSNNSISDIPQLFKNYNQPIDPYQSIYTGINYGTYNGSYNNPMMQQSYPTYGFTNPFGTFMNQSQGLSYGTYNANSYRYQ